MIQQVYNGTNEFIDYFDDKRRSVMVINSIIIDDELRAIKALQWELSAHCPSIRVLKSFQKIEPAKQFAQSNDVHLVFLDMEIGGESGLNFLDSAEDPSFQTIVISAHEGYALRTAKHHVFDYILKPVDSIELKKSIGDLENMLEKRSIADQLDARLLDILNRDSKSKKISIHQDSQIIFLNVDDIEYLKGQGSYCEVYLDDGETLILSKSIKSTLELIGMGDTFFRIHNSYVVNLRRVKRYLKSESKIYLESGTILPVSRYRKSEFMQSLDG